MNGNYWIFIWALLFISSCKKDSNPALPAAKGVYVISEGNFNFGNAEVSFYNPETKEVSNNIFQAANGYSLGDVGQSLYVMDSIGFLVVNNSAKIEVVKLPSFQKLRTITINGSSPRYFLPINDSIAYVTELFAQKIWVINYNSGALVTTIATQGWTEKLFKIDNDVFVQQKINTTLTGTYATLLKINTAAHTAQHNNTFDGRDINGMVKDKLDRIWIAVEEDSAVGLHAGFYCFDKNLTEQKSFFFSGYRHHPSQLCINGAGDELLFTDKDIFRLSIDDNALPALPLISGSGKNIYSMQQDPATGDIYMSDALDFVQQSIIYRYDKNGNLIHSFTAGIISGNFAFTND